MTYEFTDVEAEKIWWFGNKLVIVSFIMGLAGVFGFFSLIVDLNNSTRTFVLLIEFLFLIAIGVVLYRPSDNFTKIATSEGRDIQELMRGLKEFDFAFIVTAILITLIGVFNFLLIIDKI